MCKWRWKVTSHRTLSGFRGSHFGLERNFTRHFLSWLCGLSDAAQRPDGLCSRGSAEKERPSCVPKSSSTSALRSPRRSWPSLRGVTECKRGHHIDIAAFFERRGGAQQDDFDHIPPCSLSEPVLHVAAQRATVATESPDRDFPTQQIILSPTEKAELLRIGKEWGHDIDGLMEVAKPAIRKRSPAQMRRGRP